MVTFRPSSILKPRLARGSSCHWAIHNKLLKSIQHDSEMERMILLPLDLQGFVLVSPSSLDASKFLEGKPDHHFEMMVKGSSRDCLYEDDDNNGKSSCPSRRCGTKDCNKVPSPMTTNTLPRFSASPTTTMRYHHLCMKPKPVSCQQIDGHKKKEAWSSPHIPCVTTTPTPSNATALVQCALIRPRARRLQAVPSVVDQDNDQEQYLSNNKASKLSLPKEVFFPIF